MAASNGYRPMLEKEWKPEYGRPFSDLVVVDYDTHPRYGRGTVLTKSGTEIMVTGDKWRNRPISIEPIPAVSSPANETNSPANDAGLPDNEPDFEKFKAGFTPLITNDDGSPSLEKALNELYDYWRRSELLDEIVEEYSGGKMSAGRIYHFSSVKDVFDEEINQVVNSNISDIIDTLVDAAYSRVHRIDEVVKEFGSDKQKEAWVKEMLDE